MLSLKSRLIGLGLFFLGVNPLTYASQSRWVDTFVNPLDVSLADPAVFQDGSTYYIYATGLQCFSSSNLLDWRNANIFGIYRHPDNDDRYNFWAPEVIKRPSDGRYILFYTAQKPGAKLKIYAAQSNFPHKDFVEIHTDPNGAALPFFDTVAADAWIDAHPFIDTDGQAYLYVTKDISSNSSQSGRGSIFVLPLDLENLTAGDPIRVLDPDTTGWEVRPGGGADIEGAYVVKHDSQYFLLYSGNGYWADTYAVGYAVSASPTSGFVKYAGNPILRSGGNPYGPYGPGHCSVGKSPDGKEHLIFYHGKINPTSGGERQLCIDRLIFLGPPGNQSIRLDGIDGRFASATPQMLPGGVAPLRLLPEVENFNSLDLNTWHFMGENVFNRSASGGTLTINASSGDVLGVGQSISNLGLACLPQNEAWQLTVKINDFAPAADGQQVFLSIWRDQQNFVRLSDIQSGTRRFRVLKEEGGSTVSYDVPHALPDTKWLRIRKEGSQLTFFASADGISFTSLTDGATLGYSPGWARERQLAVGLGAIRPEGSPSLLARFDAVWYEVLTPSPVGATDSFDDDAPDREIWIVQGEDRTRYAEENSSHLRIRTTDGDWVGGRLDLRNVFLQTAPEGDWTITARVQTPERDANYDQAFITVVKDQDHFLKLGRAYIDGNRLEAGVESGGVWSAGSIPDPWPGTDFVQLSIRKRGNTYHFEASRDGRHWLSLGSKNATWTPLFVGLAASSPAAGHAHDYQFDDFRVSPYVDSQADLAWHLLE